MKGIILAAGMGKRLRPLTKNLPKTLLKLEGRTVLEHIISNCHKHGIGDFVVVVGHMKEEVNKVCEMIMGESDLDIVLVENNRYSDTNTGYSLRIALENIDDDVVIINGDNVFDDRIIESLLDCRNSGLVIDDFKELNDESFKIALDEENSKILIMGKGIDIVSSKGEFIGISALRRKDIPAFIKILDKLLDANEMEYYDIAYVDLNAGVDLDFVFTRGLKWTEIDDFNDLRNAKRIARELWKKGYVSDAISGQ
ncbi:MAG: phosphocholine cytidylyltransferase family protein [Candidatus Syntropharchaeales archaeon]